MTHDEMKKETHKSENFGNLRGEKVGDSMTHDFQVSPPLPPEKNLVAFSLKAFQREDDISAIKQNIELVNDGGQKSLRELTPEEKERIKALIKKAYRIELADDFCVLFGEFMANSGVSPISSLDIIGTSCSELEDDVDLEKRLKCVLLGYKKAGIDLSQYKDRIAEFPMSSFDLEENGDLHPSLHNFSSFHELLKVRFGEKKANNTIIGIQKALGTGLAVPPMKPTPKEELACSIADEVMKRHVIRTFFRIDKEGEREIGIYRYNGLIYVPYDVEIEAEIERIGRQREDIRRSITRWVVNEARERIRRTTLRELKEEPMLIAFNNAIFNWEKFLNGGSIADAIERPSPDLVAFNRIPHNLMTDVRYDDIEKLAEEKCPKALKAFKDWVNDRWIQLFEIIGCTLYPRNDMEKAIFYVGRPNHGKTQCLRLHQDILGEENYSSTSIATLCDPGEKFALADLYHKLANITAEAIGGVIKDKERFKAIVSGESLPCQRKFRDTFSFKPYAKLISASNDLPYVEGIDDAFAKRLLIIEFPNEFEKDPTFYERTFTEAEIEGIISVSLYAFRDAWSRRKFSFEEAPESYKERWLRASDPVYDFLQALLNGEIEGVRAERDKDAEAEFADVYDLYVAYCNREDRKIYDKPKFSEKIQRWGYKKEKRGGFSYIKGIRLMREGTPAKEQRRLNPQDEA